MKYKMTALTLAMAAILGLGSCFLINKTTSTSSSSATASATTAAGATTSHKHKDNSKKATSADLTDDVVGEWFITQVGDVKVTVEEDVPYLTLTSDNGRFYASNGCNVLNGSYSVNGTTLKFDNVLSTMKFCQGIPYEQGISDILKDGNSVNARIEKIGKESRLFLSDANGKVVMILVRHNMQYLNGQWLVSAINGKHINDEEANVFIDIASLKIHGNTGCNFFNGDILINPNEANSISFSGMAVTRMSCPNGDQERTMLVALEETVSVSQINSNTVAFLNSNGRQVLSLTRSDK